MRNPFAEYEDGAEIPDEQLALRGRQGDREALEQLVLRHQPWIYNLVVRMVWAETDAQDLIQDILIKMITGLPRFRNESRFRTWLYRIAVNRVFTHKKQRADAPVESYDDFTRDLEGIPDVDFPDPSDPATQLLVEEAKVLCTVAMLLCLDGTQRLVFILGEIFGVTDRVGADVLHMSPANFRQALARARRDLYNFMNGRCGLVNGANPCRCARKTKGFIQKGYMDPHHLRFAQGHQLRVRDVAPSRAQELKEAERSHAALFREHPFLSIQEQSALVRSVLAGIDVEPPR